MTRPFKWLFWTVLFLVMLLALDQFLIQVPPVHPAHGAVCRFYEDFRSRLIAVTLGEETPRPGSIEAVIEKNQAKKEPSVSSEAVKKADNQKQRYLYADEKGELQFADSLEEVPAPYRATAQPMGK